MKNRKFYYIAIAPFVLGIIFGSFFDLEINKALYAPNNAFGLGFAAFGPWIGYGFLVLLCGFFHRFAIKEKNIWLKIGFFLLSAAGLVVSVKLSADKVTSINGFNCPDWTWLWIIIVAILFIPLFILGDRYGKKTDDKAILWIMVILAGFMLIELVPIAQILKNVMRRPRYRVVAEELFNNNVIFMDWWKPYKKYATLKEQFAEGYPSFSEQFKSFPSGHASVAALLIFGLPYLTFIEPKLKGKENLLFGIGLGFTILMAFSRMTVGAHYLSDVSFGAFLMVICCIAANEIILKYFIKDKEKVAEEPQKEESKTAEE
ncbi:MAG: phosphatase PAP2 family protein [Bacilli bacterium]|nr:phosphatase PAP2 family protein [Bacilli bacterium]